MEATEVFENDQNAGWNPGGSNGEALSRILAFDAYPKELSPAGTGETWESGANWLDSDRPNWVDNTEGTDLNFVSIGCGTLFINWLRYQLGFDLVQIVCAGGATLAETFNRLTGGTNGFDQFNNLLSLRYPPGIPSGLTTDNPFPIGKEKDGILLIGCYYSSHNWIGPDIYVIYGKAKWHIPDVDTLNRLFPGKPINQIWEPILMSIDTIPVNGTMLREESNPQVYIIEGGKKKPLQPGDPFDPDRVHVLWDGALADIEFCPSIIQGHVTDKSGAPINGARLWLSPDGFELYTGPDGHYQSGPLNLGVIDIDVRADGYYGQSARVTLQAGLATIQDFALPILPLPEPITITGKVTDKDGNPIVGLMVELLEDDLISKTDGKGVYTLTSKRGGGGYTILTVYAAGLGFADSGLKGIYGT